VNKAYPQLHGYKVTVVTYIKFYQIMTKNSKVTAYVKFHLDLSKVEIKMIETKPK